MRGADGDSALDCAVGAAPGAAIVGGGDVGGAAVGGGAVGIDEFDAPDALTDDADGGAMNEAEPDGAPVGGGALEKSVASRRCERRDGSDAGANPGMPSEPAVGAADGGGIDGAAEGGGGIGGGAISGGEKSAPLDSDENPGEGAGGKPESRS